MGRLTFLRAHGGGNLTKSYSRLPDGSLHKESAPKVQEFTTEFVDYHDAESLFNAIDDKAKDPSCCLVRSKRAKYCRTDPGPIYRRASSYFGYARHDGKMQPEKHWPTNGTDTGKVYWLQTLSDQLTDWIALDVDGGNWKNGSDDWVEDLAHTAEVVRDSILPPFLHGVSCWVQATGSALDPTKPEGPERNALRLRFVFKLTRGQTAGQLRQLFRDVPNLDRCTLSVHQPIYVAHPVFGPGCYDHLEERSAIAWGERDEADPPHVAAEIIPDHIIGGDGIEEAEEGTGLVPDEAFEEALERIDGSGGSVRSKLINAAARYAERHGAVDIGAMVNRLTAVALLHRDKRDVEGYGIAKLTKWAVAQGQAKRNEQRDTGDPGSNVGHLNLTSDGPPDTGDPLDPFGEPAGPANDDNPDPAEPPVDISVEEAATTLAAAVRGWVTEGLSYHPDPGTAPPKLAIRAAAGIGKTTVTLETLAELAPGRTVHFLVPTHDLADELKAKSEAMGIPSTIIQGRGRPHPHDVNRHMCAKNDLADAVAREGLNVWKSLCENKDLIGITQEHKCEHFDHCPYIGQFSGIEGHLIIMPHNWLTLPKPKALPDPDLVVIDERFFDIGIKKSHWSWSRITRPLPFGAAPFEGFDPGEHVTTAEAVSKALWAGEHPRQHGLTVKLLETAAKAEYYLGQSHSLHPAMGAMHQKRLVQEYAAPTKKEHRTLARVYRLLAADFDLDRPSQRVHVVKGRKTPDGVVDDVQMHWTDYRIPGAPTLLIDADADPVITEPIIPGVEFLEIKPPVQARIVQVHDTVCSRRKLTEDNSSPRTLRRIAALATREANKRRGVLVVSYKPAIEMVGDIEGVETLHFGALRGLDRYKNHDTVIIAGREQTRAVVVERTARALFGRDPEPLTLPGDYVTSRRRYITRDGHERFGPVQVHPDSRVQAIVAQSRECETTQAVARLRLIHREHPATVYLLSNMPTDLTVDEFVAFGALLPDKAEQAAQESAGVELLTASELARCYPKKWPSRDAAAKFLQRRDKGTNPLRDSMGKMSRCAVQREATYRTPTSHKNARPYRAIIPGHLTFSEGIDALVKVVGEITRFSEDPRHDGPDDDDAQEASA